MRRETRLLWILGALGSMPQWAISQESFVGCPVELLDTAVVSKLPNGWWATPQQGELLSTQVAAIGGQQTLVCNYAGFGAKIGVMRELPAGVASCSPKPGGFACEKGVRQSVTQSSAEVPVVTNGRDASGRVSGPSPQTQSGEPRIQIRIPDPNPRKPGDGIE